MEIIMKSNINVKKTDKNLINTIIKLKKMKTKNMSL